jgi:hypothetical protein
VAQNPTNAIVARLEADWPRWQIWTVSALSAAPSGVRAAGITRNRC